MSAELEVLSEFGSHLYAEIEELIEIVGEEPETLRSMRVSKCSSSPYCTLVLRFLNAI